MYSHLRIVILSGMFLLSISSHKTTNAQVVRSGVSFGMGSLVGHAAINENNIILNNKECLAEDNFQIKAFPSFVFLLGYSNTVQFKYYHFNLDFNINANGFRYKLKYPNNDGILENIDQHAIIYSIGIPFTLGRTFFNNNFPRLYLEAGASFNIPLASMEYDKTDVEDNDIYLYGADENPLKNILYTKKINYNIIFGAGIDVGLIRLTFQYNWYLNSFSKYHTSVGNLAICAKVYIASSVKTSKRKIYHYDSRKK